MGHLRKVCQKSKFSKRARPGNKEDATKARAVTGVTSAEESTSDDELEDEQVKRVIV